MNRHRLEKSGAALQKKEDLSSDAADAGLQVKDAAPEKISKEGFLRVASEAFLDKTSYPNVPVITKEVNTPWDFIAWA